jgi:hypothetical protein
MRCRATANGAMGQYLTHALHQTTAVWLRYGAGAGRGSALVAERLLR